MNFREKELFGFLKDIGSNTQLVQGAGGNVSWKDHGVLWIKASGTWLRDVDHSEIFVSLDLAIARDLVSQGATDFSSSVLQNSSLRPSIETSFHALLEWKYVVHLHAVDIIARVVKRNFEKEFRKILNGDLIWASVPYCKPGPDLARAIRNCIQENRATRVFFLANHGLIVAGDSVGDVRKILNEVLLLLSTTARKEKNLSWDKAIGESLQRYGFIAPHEQAIQYLALDPSCLAIMDKHWALYPDHVVFLGAQPNIIDGRKPIGALINDMDDHAQYVIVPQRGVFVRRGCPESTIMMLGCYAEILRRLSVDDDVMSLTPQEVTSLLNWDAEKYRQAL